MSAELQEVVREYKPTESFGYLLHEVTKAWRAALDELMRPMDLSSATLTVICSLAFSPKPLTQRELAAKVNVEGPTLVRLLDRLEHKGWVRREQVPGDRRMKHVVLTDKGLPYFDELVRVAEQLQARLLDSIDPERLKAAYEVLLTLGGRLGVDLENKKCPVCARQA